MGSHYDDYPRLWDRPEIEQEPELQLEIAIPDTAAEEERLRREAVIREQLLRKLRRN